MGNPSSSSRPGRHAAVGEGTGALEKALDVLDAIGAAPEGLSQNDLAARLQLPRTTVYRLLATLVGRGLVRRDPLRKVYCLGFRCFEMARQAYAMPDLAAAAATELRTLRDLTGETTYFATLDGREVISLDRCDGAHSLRSAAAPVVDGAGEVRGAISVAGPAWRLTRARLELLGPEVAEAARRIGAQLPPLQPAAISESESAVHAVPGDWAFHGACPVVSTGGSVYWADVLAPTVRRFDARGDRQVFTVEAPIVGLIPRPDGLIVVHEHGAALIHPDEAVAAPPPSPLSSPSPPPSPSLSPWPWPEGRTLAACAGPDGRLWAALALPEAGTAIGQVQPDGRLQVHWRIGEPLAALSVRSDDGSLFATAPQSGAILVLVPGQPGVRRLATVPKGSGRLGGLAFDDQGGIWAALCDGWSVVRFTMDGQVERVIGLPVPCATDLAFRIEKDRRQLVITTQRHSVALEVLATAPLSGRLLVAAL